MTFLKTMVVPLKYTIHLLGCLALLVLLRAFYSGRQNVAVATWVTYWQQLSLQSAYIPNTASSPKWIRPIQTNENEDKDPETIWEQISGHQTLVWRPCYPDPDVEYQCTRLLVPLDHSKPLSSSNQASLALIRIASSYPPDSKEYKGPILFNPGGPGVSGVELVLVGGKLIRFLLGEGYDIVGFDPRGVSRSRPFVSSFRNDIERFTYRSRLSAFDVFNTSTNSLAEFVAGSHVMNQLAAKLDKGPLEFMNTDHAARDMMHIVKAHGRDKLFYWGFSYGSILGATFATIFPDNVGRIIIDGVVDAEDYYTTSWASNLIDTEKVLDSFFTSCHEAGPSDCSFYAPTPEAISENLSNLLEKLKTQPVPFVLDSKDGEIIQYGVIDYNVLKHFIFTTLFQPYQMFPYLADVLTSLSKGTGMPPPPPPYPASKNLMGKGIGFDENFGMHGLDLRERLGDAMSAFVCNDGEPVPGTVEDVVAHYEKTSKISSWADIWTIRAVCSGWPKLPRHYPGPITANTSHPLLIIGTTADPVTPLIGAIKMSKAFPGSALLVQDSPGHCSISGPSLCSMQYVREYFDDGTLPEEGTICPVLGPPIPGLDLMAIRNGKDRTIHGQAVLGQMTSERDWEVADAIVELSRRYTVPRFR